MERLGQAKKSGGPGGNKTIIFFTVIISVVLILAGLRQYGVSFSSLIPSNASSKDDDKGSDLKEYQEFAVHVVVALNNIGFQNAQTHLSDIGQYFSQDLLDTFQKTYFDDEYLKMIADRKLFVSSQDVQAIASTNEGDTIGVWVTGKNTYSSALTGTMKTVPFSIRLYMKKMNNQIKVVKFRLADKYE